MANRLAILAAMLAILLAAALPALAQGQQYTATGVLGELGPIGQDPEPVYSITDEETGAPYELISGFVTLDDYVGERVTIEGTPVPGPGSPDRPPLLNVTEIEPAEGPPPGPTPDRSATLSFELTVEGEPPEGTTFFGAVPAEGCISVPLADPDGDGVYTGSTDVPRFPPGPVAPDTEPVSLPVQIVQAGSGASPCDPISVIEDFGVLPIEGDETFVASVSFNGEDPADDPVTATFELQVTGEVPAGTGFSGEIGSAPTATGALLDQDGDGTYTTSLPVERSSEQEVRIERLDPINDDPAAPAVATTLKDFGAVTFDENKTFRAEIDFSESGRETTTPEGTTPVEGEGSNGGSNDSDSGGSGTSSGSASNDGGGIASFLPSTGGMALTVLVVGVLLVAGGLLIRKLSR